MERSPVSHSAGPKAQVLVMRAILTRRVARDPAGAFPQKLLFPEWRLEFQVFHDKSVSFVSCRPVRGPHSDQYNRIVWPYFAHAMNDKHIEKIPACACLLGNFPQMLFRHGRIMFQSHTSDRLALVEIAHTAHEHRRGAVLAGLIQYILLITRYFLPWIKRRFTYVYLHRRP